MTRFRLYFASLFTYCVLVTSALEVSPDSPCAKRCIDDPVNGNVSDGWASLTSHSDLSCFDWEYAGDNATDKGKKFKDCQECMKWSGYKDEDPGAVEKDAGWFLFNNRATVDWCVFGRFAEDSNPNVSTAYPYKQCYSDCKSIEGASDYKIKANPGKYDWCDFNGNYITDADKCVSCLYNATSLTMVAL
ncbi:hypothetical protein K469DRAFT_699629 [Zopfia rhizophila CBS 207.26]|uniref:Secreted protein n=1 Tax=Zopfia rhizophila CBS 207.26 TaxID=1314779 RepID=A0A6A6EDG1_9PEZI|nr:hypothetical protein K469DRAFT_699629 [Zopfia rhizophila CBS 207.26]